MDEPSCEGSVKSGALLPTGGVAERDKSRGTSTTRTTTTANSNTIRNMGTSCIRPQQTILNYLRLPSLQQKSARLNMMEHCAFYDGETRRGSDGNRRFRGSGNQGVGRFPGLCSFQRWPQPGRAPAAAVGVARAARGRHQPAVLGDYTVSEYDSVAAAAAVSRQPGDGTPHQEPGSLECAGHGGARQ